MRDSRKGVAHLHEIFRIVSPRFRKKRMQRFADRFGIAPETTILDVGGTWSNWELLNEKPQVVVLNLYGPPPGQQTTKWVVGSGLMLPFGDDTFDIVYSNSVIEHLGTLANQRRFADELRRVGRRYYVQTPNKRFVIEPHLITPLIHYLPKQSQRRLLRNGTVWGWLTRPSQESCDQFLSTTRLLNCKEFQDLFDFKGQVWKERFLGLVKSFIAIGPLELMEDRPEGGTSVVV